jgi:hypothetical protein
MNEKAAPQPSQEFLLRYDTGVRRMAEDLGLPETEVRAALEFKPGKTADCLRPEEVENFAGLGADRRAHIDTCEFCRELEQAMNAAPRETGLPEFRDLAEEARCPSCGQPWHQTNGLEKWLRGVGVSDNIVANLRTEMQNADVEEYLNTARDYISDASGKATVFAKDNPGKVAAGVAVIAIGTGLLIRALNRD